MYDKKVFAQGIWGIFKAEWVLRCETPLVIRNGQFIHYTALGQSDESNKSRGLGIGFHWSKSNNRKEPDVAALHYGYEVTDQGVRAYHFVPPSSVRGALRGWTISHLVAPQYRRGMTPPPKEQVAEMEAYVDRVRDALEKEEDGYQLVGSVFGLAAASGFEKEMAENAGRLRVETERFDGAKIEPIQANGTVTQGMAGPGNVRREMVVRNPLDRVSHASKEHGLHQFLQFCKGEQFVTRLEILNPTDQDLGLLGLWWQELQNGLLRIGALASIGRGRMEIADESYHLWLRKGVTGGPNLAHFKREPDGPEEEALAGIWEAFRLPSSKLYKYGTSLSTHLGGRDA